MNKKINVSKALITSIGLHSILIVSVAVIFIDIFVLSGEASFNGRYVLLLTIFLILIINSYISIKDAHSHIVSNLKNDMLKDSLSQLEHLNNTLRAQRHDFLNHIQVVYSLVQMKEYHDVEDYIERIFKDIQKVGYVLKTSNPAVNALLQAKMINCQNKGTSFLLEVHSQLKDLPIPAWEVCRVLGNLIDNAIYAVNETRGLKLIHVKIDENLKYFSFQVQDNGPEIPEDIRNKIFEPGFTTKGESGQGMGLAIIKEILRPYHGEIVVKSDERMTTFQILIPRSIFNT